MLLISQISSIDSPENTHLMKTMDAVRIFHTTIFEKVSPETWSWCIAMPMTMMLSFWNTTSEWRNAFLSQSISKPPSVKQKEMEECVHKHQLFLALLWLPDAPCTPGVSCVLRDSPRYHLTWSCYHKDNYNPLLQNLPVCPLQHIPLPSLV